MNSLLGCLLIGNMVLLAFLLAPPERSFYPYTALLPLAIHQELLREIALSAGKNPAIRRTPLTKTASKKLHKAWPDGGTFMQKRREML